MPKVSVIIPVYNAENRLRCLNPLLSQTFGDFEAICINDGSEDNSLQILKEYQEKDNRIKVHSQTHSGPAQARHKAISCATGKYIMFCDADDCYSDDMIEIMVNAIEKYDTDIVVCDTNVHNNESLNNEYKTYEEYPRLKHKGYHDITLKLATDINYLLWNKIFKKEIIDKYNLTYPERYEHDDTVFVMKYLLYAKKYYGVTKQLYNYFINNQNSVMDRLYTNKNFNHEYDFCLALKDFLPLLSEREDISEELKQKNMTQLFFHLRHFYLLLPEDKREGGYNCILELTNEYKILLRNKNFAEIFRCKNRKELDVLFKESFNKYIV